MDDKKLESYEQEIDDSALSNPFSNAFKNILQKLHLIKSDQKLIGDRETNSKGYQITSKDPLAATDKKSLKSILRNAFENHQQKRAEKIRAKNTANTMPKYTIGKQEPSVEQNPTIKEPTIEVIKPITAAERAAMRAQQAPTIENISVDTTAIENINEVGESDLGSDSSADTGVTDGNNIKKENPEPTVSNMVVMAETTVGEIEVADDTKSKNTNIKRKDETDSRDL